MKLFNILALIITLNSSFAIGAANDAAIHVIDGDTIDIGETRFRLHGIDSPEAGQQCTGRNGKPWSCGKAAVAALEEKVLKAQRIVCDNRGDDGRNRTIAVCFVDGLDVNGWLVQMGHAWAFTKFSMDYAELEQQAKDAELGVHQAPSQTPWEYRAAKWKVGAQQSPDGCPIKGNISSNGKIYHPPWSPWYGRTKINTSKGERWFCDEAEAIRAGWRALQWGRKR